ncbi:hypothetical protein U9M48_037490 [Paspalum notatum var. saurae]|uniref:Uncharacterized protein n=1 Tax=Paspalum notatum var. saurae TaxID=547442 RepID=A0AAQ3XB41_PASNO
MKYRPGSAANAGDPTPRSCRAEKLAIYSRGGRPTTAAPALICAPGRAPKDRGAADTKHLLLTSRTTSDTRRVPGKDATDGSPRGREDKPPRSVHTEARRRPSASIASRAIGHLHLPGEGVRPPLLPSADAARPKELPTGVRIVQHLGRLHCRPPMPRRAARQEQPRRHHDRRRVSTDGGGAMRAHRDAVYVRLYCTLKEACMASCLHGSL